MCFLRFSYVERLKCCSIVVNNIYLGMFLEQSKTDMYPKRIWMHLTINSNLGPIIVVSKYLNIETTAETFQRYRLRDVMKTKTCSRL